ncbi:MAG: sulfotransferase [Gammaproteobacteria bacterium]|nr:sulfotransferase [Gammaproteobacteria bacterium]MDH3464359.1 sulfotransferase [Gammaproteobacteria bacterium]
MATISDKLELAGRNIKLLDKKRLFFVSGISKSGTTWLERVLDSHPEIICKGEAHFGSLLEPAIRNTVAEYNARIPRQGNWSRHRKENTTDNSSSSYIYDTSDLDFLLATAIKLMLVKWANVDTVKCVGEKTPNNFTYYPLLARLFPDSKYIYMIRDVRDVIVSAWFYNLAVGSDQMLRQFVSIERYAVHVAKVWAAEVSSAMTLGRPLGNNYCEIQYENLWQNPEHEVGRLLEFLDVSTSDSVINECLGLTDFSKLSGGRPRGTENRSSFYRKGVVGDWKNHLDDTSIAEVKNHCGSLMSELGYD